MGFFDKILSFLGGIADEFTRTVSDVLNIKSIAADEFAALQKELKEATQEFEDFEERIKHLRTKVVRADVIFKLFDEIRTGALKDWVEKELTDLKDSIVNIIDEGYNTAQQVGAVKATGAGGFIGRVISAIRAIAKAYKMATFVTHALRGLTPVFQDVHKKLKEFESVVMRQDKPEVQKTGPHRSRK